MGDVGSFGFRVRGLGFGISGLEFGALWAVLTLAFREFMLNAAFSSRRDPGFDFGFPHSQSKTLNTAGKLCVNHASAGRTSSFKKTMLGEFSSCLYLVHELQSPKSIIPRH